MIIEKYEEYNLNDIVIIVSNLVQVLIINDWIIKRLYIFKTQITFQKSITIIQLNLPKEIKKEI